MTKSFHKIVDGSRPPSPEEFFSLFKENRLLVFRDFPREKLESFLQSLGSFRNQSLSGTSHFKQLTYPAEAGDPRDIGAMPWHHDCPFLDPTPTAVALYCEKPSDSGGETDWVDLSQVWERLPEALKGPLRSLDVIHKASCFEKYVHFPHDPGAFSTYEEQVRFVESLVSRKPLVRKDELRDLKYIYCSEGYTDQLLSADETLDEGVGSQGQRSEILQMVNQASEQFYYRQEWQRGDLAIADNQSLSHRRWPWSNTSDRFMIRAQMFLDSTRR